MSERQRAVNMNALELMADMSTEDSDDFLVVLTADPDGLRDTPLYDTRTDTLTGGVGIAGDRTDTQAQSARDTSPTVRKSRDEGPTGAVPPT